MWWQTRMGLMMLCNIDCRQSVFLCFIFVFSALFYHWTAVPVLNDPDGYWHLEAGKLLLESGRVPYSDPWSFTAGDYAWYNLSWVFDAVSAFVYESLGQAGLQSMMIVFYGGLLTFLCWVLVQHERVSISAACLTTMLVSLSMWELFSLRPHVLTYLFVVACYYVLRSAYQGRERWLCSLPFLMLLWVNVHGGFLAGYVMMMVFALVAIIEKNYRFFLKLSLMVLISVPILVLNPYGVDVADAVLRSLDSVITAYIDEWQPFVPGQYVGITAYFVFFILLACFPRKQDAPLYDKCLALVWAVLAITSMRHFPIFALLSAPYMAWILSESGFIREYKRLPRWCTWVMVVLVLCLPISIGAKWLPQGLFYKPYEASRIRIDPEVIEVLEQFPERRFLNHYAMGGWLIYHSGGQHRVFIDSRAGTAYPEKLLQDYLQLMKSRDNWVKERILEYYGINGVVTSKHHPFAEMFKESYFLPYWQIVFEGEDTIVFIKQTLFALDEPADLKELALWSH